MATNEELRNTIDHTERRLFLRLCNLFQHFLPDSIKTDKPLNNYPKKPTLLLALMIAAKEAVK